MGFMDNKLFKNIVSKVFLLCLLFFVGWAYFKYTHAQNEFYNSYPNEARGVVVIKGDDL